MHSDLCTQGSATRAYMYTYYPLVHLHELYETPTRYTRCAYFNDLINCRHGQYVQWLSSLYRFSHLSPKIIRRPFFLRLSFFSFPPFFFFFLLYARHWKLVYWVIRGIINAALKNTRFFLTLLSSFSFFFFLCFFFEKNLKS